MGAVCSCACGSDYKKPIPKSGEAGYLGPVANPGDPGYPGPVATRSKPLSGAAVRSGVVQSAAVPQPGEPGFEEWQKGQLLARTADEFGINLDPAANVALEGEVVQEHGSMVDDEDLGEVCIDPSRQPMRFGYKIHHHCIRRHGSSLIAAHEVKGHYTDTGIYLAYDVLQKILAGRHHSGTENQSTVEQRSHTQTPADSAQTPIFAPGLVTESENMTAIRKSLAGIAQSIRGSLPVNNTFRNSVATGGNARKSEDYQSIDALHRDLATE